MRKSLTLIFLLLVSVLASAQVDKKDVRRGNRQFAKEKYGDADISYRKGLNADSTSVASAYNLGNNLYRQGNYAEAGKFYQQALRHVPETRSLKKQSKQGFDTYFNLGDAALQQKQYRAAMEAFVQALLINPDDLEAKENYVYARKMLENNPDGGGGGNDQQNQDQNQDQKDNKDEGDDGQRQEENPEQQEDEQQDDGSAEDEKDSPEEREVEALLKKAQERSDEHEAEKKARMRKAKLPPNERDW